MEPGPLDPEKSALHEATAPSTNILVHMEIVYYLCFSFQNGEYSLNSYAYTNTRNLKNKET